MSDEYREELKIKLINVVAPTLEQSDISDIRFKIEIALADYEIEKRSTELTVYTEGKNDAILKRFLASKLAAGLSQRTLEYYRNSIRFFFNRINKDYDEISADDIRIYLAARINREGVSKTTANNERRNLSAFYSWLQTEEIILKNPMRKVSLIKDTKKKKKAFSDLDMEKLRANCKTLRETAMIEVLISTWCRVSELAQIRIDEISGNEILIHGKGDKERLVYLNAKASYALERYMAERKDNNPYLFPKAKYAGQIEKMCSGARKKQAAWYTKANLVDEKEHMDKGSIEGIIRAIGKRAGVEKTHPHRFRRTGATAALQSGMELITVSKLLGHSNLGVTQIYLDISDEELQQAHQKYVK